MNDHVGLFQFHEEMISPVKFGDLTMSRRNLFNTIMYTFTNKNIINSNQLILIKYVGSF